MIVKNFLGPQALTLIRPSFSVSPQAWGGGEGGICPQNFFSFYWPIFHRNQLKHGLKWNLASLHTYKNFEQHPINRSFPIRQCQSNLVEHWNFRFFDLPLFEKKIIFILHGQYANQMKAEIILNLYLLLKSTIVDGMFWKNWMFDFLW